MVSPADTLRRWAGGGVFWTAEWVEVPASVCGGPLSLTLPHGGGRGHNVKPNGAR